MDLFRRSKNPTKPTEVTTNYNAEESRIYIQFASQPRQYTHLLSNAYRFLDNRNGAPTAHHVRGVNTGMYVKWKGENAPSADELDAVSVNVTSDIANIATVKENLDTRSNDRTFATRVNNAPTTRVTISGLPPILQKPEIANLEYGYLTHQSLISYGEQREQDNAKNAETER